MKKADYVIVGGGIVGLATARSLSRSNAGARIVILEKEDDVAMHQTGRNSGVVHSGIYYRPGSLKSQMATRGADSIRSYCRSRGIPYERCGKIIVATEEGQLRPLDHLRRRAEENGVPARILSREEALEVEPHVRCVRALEISSTGITDYVRICRSYLEDVLSGGGEIRFGSQVVSIVEADSHVRIETEKFEIESRIVVNCCGLHSDRMATSSGGRRDVRIVPFRGEYFTLKASAKKYVKNLIYPVPNPEFPFLGVHLTRMIDGEVHAGPNAVLAFAREGYRRSDINVRDLLGVVSFTGFWRLAAKHWREGAAEIYRSLSKRAFTESLQELVPEIEESDLQPCKAGVRAQAVRSDGGLVDDFLVDRRNRVVDVLNAPSPAATASLEIGDYIADRVPKLSEI